MADITKCEGKWCEERMQCYRYTALPGMRQSWAAFESRRKEGESCEHMLVRDEAGSLEQHEIDKKK